MADKTELGCGLMVWQGNRLEDLRDLLLGWLARQPLAPLENDVFLVQSQGMGQWLKLALAGESGVSAAVSMQLPAQFLWRAYRRVLGEAAVPERSALDREALIWRILRLLPTLQDQPVFAPLQHFLRDDGDGRKRYQLAGKLAELSIFGGDYPTRDGTGVRDYIHVSDLAAAHVAAIDLLIAEPGKSHTLNAGYGKGFSVLEVLDAVDRVTNRKLNRVIEGRRAGDAGELVADNRAILATLDWTPQRADLDLIVRDALAWERKLGDR